MPGPKPPAVVLTEEENRDLENLFVDTARASKLHCELVLYWRLPRGKTTPKSQMKKALMCRQLDAGEIGGWICTPSR